MLIDAFVHAPVHVVVIDYPNDVYPDLYLYLSHERVASVHALYWTVQIDPFHVVYVFLSYLNPIHGLADQLPVPRKLIENSINFEHHQQK